MPHIIVEYSDTLSMDISELTKELHNTLGDLPTVDINTVRTRAMPVQHTITGAEGYAKTLIHITLKLLPGRDDALRKTMAQALFEAAYQNRPDDNTTITVETVELHEPSYSKFSLKRRSSDV